MKQKTYSISLHLYKIVLKLRFENKFLLRKDRT